MGIVDSLDYKIVTPEEFNSKPFGNEEVQILGVNWGMPDLTNQVLDANPSITWVHSFSAGVDTFMNDGMKARADHITLTNAKGAFSESLGEFVAFAMLWFAKNGQKWLDDKAAKKWNPGFVSMLSSKTLGIIGYGDIGCECARVAKDGFRMNTIAVKRDPTKTNDKQKANASEIFSNSDEDLANFFSKSDFVLNVMPFTPQTENFFDLAKFKQMKPEAIFMNIGRGKSVVEDDLITALKEKVIAGAYLDVFANEPFPADSELWNFENVYMTPHCADWSWDIFERSN
jgi:phosphoglycerate dehydrogenase-like enzyme